MILFKAVMKKMMKKKMPWITDWPLFTLVNSNCLLWPRPVRILKLKAGGCIFTEAPLPSLSFLIPFHLFFIFKLDLKFVLTEAGCIFCLPCFFAC